MSSPTVVVTPSSVDDPVEVPEVVKPPAPERRISERSGTAGTVTTAADTESVSLSSVGSETEHEESAEPSSKEPPETSFSHLSISTSGSASSILKRHNGDRSSIKDSKRAWKCLPKPDLDVIIGNASTSSDTAATTALNESISSRKSVKWDVVQIRSYRQTIGDNPSVSYGTPIQLDWDYDAQEDVDLESYEMNRGTRRTLRQMVLSYYHRKNVLSWQYGHTMQEIKAAKKEANRVKFKREITRNFLIAMPAEAVVESARRKAKRFFEKKD